MRIKWFNAEFSRGESTPLREKLLRVHLWFTVSFGKLFSHLQKFFFPYAYKHWRCLYKTDPQINWRNKICRSIEHRNCTWHVYFTFHHSSWSCIRFQSYFDLCQYSVPSFRPTLEEFIPLTENGLALLERSGIHVVLCAPVNGGISIRKWEVYRTFNMGNNTWLDPDIAWHFQYQGNISNVDLSCLIHCSVYFAFPASYHRLLMQN